MFTKIPKFINDLFTPKNLQGLDSEELMVSLADPFIRKAWILSVFEEMKQLNLEVDKQLLSKELWMIQNLAIRRRAIQDMLEKVALAKRRVKTQTHEPSGFDLDSVTVEPV